MKQRDWLLLTIIPAAIGVFMVLAWQASTTSTKPPPSTPPPAQQVLRPSPDLPPQAVVKIVVDALRHNDYPEPDAGIKTAYRFASPRNREVTGPLDRFTHLLKSPQYRPFIMPHTVAYTPVQINGDKAGQHIQLTLGDRTVTYMIGLQRQSDGDYAGCWMTDAVMVVDAGPAPRKQQPKPPVEMDEDATPI